MFTRLLVGLDGGVRADVALEQAVVLGKRFGATLVVAHVRESGTADEPELLARARVRVDAVPLPVETVARAGEADLLLAELARDCDAVLVGRRGLGAGGELGRTTSALVRVAERPVIVCGGAPSPLRVCAVAFDGSEPAGRALELAARFAAVADSTVHVIHASDDAEAARTVIGKAEMVLSLQTVEFQTHVRAGTPAAVVGAVAREACIDVLFAGAHVRRKGPGRPSPVLVSHAEDLVNQTAIPVLVQP